MTAHYVQPEPAELRSLMLKGWMTHDAMWFATTLARHGIDETNIMNRTAVRSMAAIEAKRVAKLFGLPRPVATPDGLREFFDRAIESVIPDFMEFHVQWAPDNTSVTFRVTSCFAFDGVSALGVADRYECGIFERIHGWFDALEVTYTETPETALCTMPRTGSCARTLRFDL